MSILVTTVPLVPVCLTHKYECVKCLCHIYSAECLTYHERMLSTVDDLGPDLFDFVNATGPHCSDISQTLVGETDEKK